MPIAYLVVESNISDPEAFKHYMAASPEVVRAFGGEYLVRGGKVEVLEGDWTPDRIVVLKFPSFAAAQAFSASAEYTKARAARQGAALMRMVVVEGV